MPPRSKPSLPYEQRISNCAVELTMSMDVATDLDLSRAHDIPIDVVRELRQGIRRDTLTLKALVLAMKLQAVSGWKGSRAELIERALESAVERAQRRRDREDLGGRRSADGTTSRSLLPAQAAEGESGRKGPESTATARRRESTSRDGRGSGAARVSEG